MACRSFPESEGSISQCAIGCGHEFIVSWMHIVKECFCPECGMAVLIEPQSGMTSKHWRVEPFAEILTSSPLGSLNFARTLALQAVEKAWQESEAAFIGRSTAWPKKSGPRSYSLKTQREFWQTEDCKSLNRLPPSGIHVDGLLRAVKRLARPNNVKGGFVWPTPAATDYKRRDWPGDRRRKSPNLPCMLNIQYKTTGLKTNPLFLEWMMSFPFGWTELSVWVIPYIQGKRRKPLRS
jgi:hypothetical protein